MMFNIVSVLFGLCLIKHGFGFENGKFYEIRSEASDKVMTISDNSFSRGSTVVTSLWTSTDQQKWMALEENGDLISPHGRVVGGPKKFFLVPKRQKWSWNTFSQNSTTFNITSIPQHTLVLSLDNSVGNVTLEIYEADSSSQKWVTEATADDHVVIIKNWGNQQCIKNFDHKPMNIFQLWTKRIRSFFGPHKRKNPSPLGTLTCNRNDISQKWTVEVTN